MSLRPLLASLVLAATTPATVPAPQPQPQTAASPARVSLPASDTLSPADRERLARLVEQHRATRDRLSAEDRKLLDRLTALVHGVVAATKPPKDLWVEARAYVHRLIPTLADAEVGSLTAYSMDGIAAGDDAAVASEGAVLRETQMSFNLQYLALQTKMQNENRTYTAISNILKTKHDTVKNSINNVR
jgi:hypothetical protein